MANERKRGFFERFVLPVLGIPLLAIAAVAFFPALALWVLSGLILGLIVRQARRAASTESLHEDAREVEVAGRIYRLVASRAAAGTLLPEAGVLVLVDRLSPGLPTTQELRVAFGLRGREPQIALLAAEGLSNAVIAQRLRLSAHTVRHYLERVLGRLGLHTRKALALHLMAGGGERPQPPSRQSH